MTAWQSFAHDLVNAAVPHLVEQQHVERPLLGDLDGLHYQGLQSLHERKGLAEEAGQIFWLMLEGVHTALQTGSISHTLGREGQLTVCVLVHIVCITYANRDDINIADAITCRHTLLPANKQPYQDM